MLKSNPPGDLLVALCESCWRLSMNDNGRFSFEQTQERLLNCMSMSWVQERNNASMRIAR